MLTVNGWPWVAEFTKNKHLFSSQTPHINESMDWCQACYIVVKMFGKHNVMDYKWFNNQKNK